MEVVSLYLGAVGQLPACIYFALLLLTCRSTLLTFPALRAEYTCILLALKMKKKIKAQCEKGITSKVMPVVIEEADMFL